MIRPYSLLQNELSTLDFFGIQEVEMSKNKKAKDLKPNSEIQNAIEI
jgi:hypothetical protein